MGASFNSTGHELQLPEIAFGDGVHLVDGDGKRYLDLTSGVWCISVGHRNERVDQAIRSQLALLSHAGFSYSQPIVEEAAASLLSVCGMDDGGAVFLCSGSEAIDYARQVAKRITNRELSLTFHDAYLGSLSSVLDRSANWVIFDWENCDFCVGGRRAANCDHFDEIPEDISEFLFEPGSSAGQVRFAPVPVVRRIVDIVKGNGGKIIANEVTTGIGRTGSWFGHDHYGITPDVIVVGKGIGNGYPVSAVAMNGETRRQLEATDFKYMQSHQNDPLGAAVVKEVIAVIRDEGLIDQAAANGAVFLEAVHRLREQPAVAEVRGRGMMYAVDLSDEAAASRVYHAMFERGYIVCLRGATLRIDPSLTTPRAAFLAFVDDFEEALQALSGPYQTSPR
ncbi:aminotransferase class III-fold pyridoxal phosphate-dependent enzyme [Actinomycetota bacterium]